MKPRIFRHYVAKPGPISPNEWCLVYVDTRGVKRLSFGFTWLDVFTDLVLADKLQEVARYGVHYKDITLRV